MHRGVSEEPQERMTLKLNPNNLSAGMTARDKSGTDEQKQDEEINFRLPTRIAFTVSHRFRNFPFNINIASLRLLRGIQTCDG